MNFISSFFRKIFGQNQEKKEAEAETYQMYMDRAEKEKQERIIVVEEELKNWFVPILKEKKNISFTWESGNDEAFVRFQNMTEDEEDILFELGEYIVEKLDIPDAGEFEMNGQGTIYLENNLIKVRYSSTVRYLVDYNEKTKERTYSIEEEDVKEEVLFAI